MWCSRRIMVFRNGGLAWSCSHHGLAGSNWKLLALLSSQYPTVQDAIGALAPLKAGEVDRFDPLHRCSHLSETNFKRIREARPGGSWKEWDQELVTDCHRASTGRGYSSVYGRMVWDEPAPTITTQFYGFGNGRFGHPEQDRALSLREGAILQSFPPDYEFIAPGQTIYFSNVCRIIGNAVPVLLARAIARSIRRILRTAGDDCHKLALRTDNQLERTRTPRNQSLQQRSVRPIGNRGEFLGCGRDRGTDRLGSSE